MWWNDGERPGSVDVDGDITNLVLVHALQTRSREVGLAVMHVMAGQFKKNKLLHTQLLV